MPPFLSTWSSKALSPSLAQKSAIHFQSSAAKEGLQNPGDDPVAKNYLHEPEIDELNRVVTMWLDFAEDQARRRKQIFLKDWAERLDAFLAFNERQVLDCAWRVSKWQADDHAEHNYERYAAQRRALLEAEGAEFHVRALEDAAKTLPEPDKKRNRE